MVKCLALTNHYSRLTIIFIEDLCEEDASLKIAITISENLFLLFPVWKRKCRATDAHNYFCFVSLQITD